MREKYVLEKQTNYLIKGIAFFWFLTKIGSYKTWITERVYPVIPPISSLENIPAFVHQFLFGASLSALLLVVCIKPNRWLLTVLFLLEVMSCSLDTVRWQPWEYMYLCFLLLVILNFYKRENILILGHLFLVSVYIFSGLHKFSRSFLSLVWLNMFLRDFLGLSMDFILKYKLFFVGLLIPFFEVLLALLLLVSKSKRVISYLLIGMHVSILIFIGPFGLKYNSIVWLWNFAMIFILGIIYSKPMEGLNKKTIATNALFLVLWFVLPVFSFWGNWFQYFSFNLYSGKGYQMNICISQNVKELKPYFEAEPNNFCKGTPCINLQEWAFKEIKSAPIPEIEIQRKIAVYLKKKYQKKNIQIILYNREENKMIKL